MNPDRLHSCGICQVSICATLSYEAIYTSLLCFETTLYVIIVLCEVSGFRHGVDKVFALLGCYAIYVGSCVLIFRSSQGLMGSIPGSEEIFSSPKGPDLLSGPLYLPLIWFLGPLTGNKMVGK
jgi:hypothetical protein